MTLFTFFQELANFGFHFPLFLHLHGIQSVPNILSKGIIWTYCASICEFFKTGRQFRCSWGQSVLILKCNTFAGFRSSTSTFTTTLNKNIFFLWIITSKLPTAFIIISIYHLLTKITFSNLCLCIRRSWWRGRSRWRGQCGHSRWRKIRSFLARTCMSLVRILKICIIIMCNKLLLRK